jgi:hypothetical protein
MVQLLEETLGIAKSELGARARAAQTTRDARRNGARDVCRYTTRFSP